MEKFIKNAILFDFYGGLLTQRQQDVFRYYYHLDYSLAEVAEKLNISRQGVRDNLQRTEAALQEFERQLALNETYEKQRKGIQSLQERLRSLQARVEDPAIQSEIEEIRNSMNSFLDDV
ncbi:MAG TPA: DNA-binding protein [Eubacteriaceae bacterium]|nr:DNA-binding protein [Eubacteriaceae bacterium]